MFCRSSKPSRGFTLINRGTIKVAHSGFTLIEILVALSIVALVAGIAIPNLRNFNQTQEIDNASSQLINVLKTAQSSAGSRIRCPAGQTATSWFVDLNNTGTNDTYSLGSFCQSGDESYVITNSRISGTSADQSAFQVDSDRCPGQTIRVHFTYLSVSYQCLGSLITSGGVRITLTKTGSTLTRSIVVEQGGTIRSD
jgi:prepilin-type N-terminal cleavage/methylation domain-containing protein